MTRSNKVVALALSCCIFLAIGLNSAMLGPVLPDLAKNTGISLGAAGSLITSLFLGALITQFVLGPINDRLGPRPILIVGMALMSAGLVAVSLSSSLVPALIFMFVAGIGTGGMIISTNVMLAVVFAARSVPALNFANVFYGIGAVCAPALGSFLTSQWGSALPVMWVVAGMIVLLLPAMLLLKVPRSVRVAQAEAGGTAAASIYKSPTLWLLGVVMLIYVGTEAGVGSWGITYLNRSSGMALDTASFALSGFWLALTAGRLTGGFVGAALGARNLLTICFAGGTAGALLLLLLGGNAPLMAAALLLLGFSIGSVYPTMVSFGASTFPTGPGKAAGFVMAMGSVGGMVLPLLLGALLDWRGTYSSMALLLACCVTMLVLHLWPGIARSRARVDAIANL